MKCDDCGGMFIVVVRTTYGAKFCRRCAFIPDPEPKANKQKGRK